MSTQCLEGSCGLIIQEAKIIKIKHSILSTGTSAVTLGCSAADMQDYRFFIVSLLNTERYHSC